MINTRSTLKSVCFDWFYWVLNFKWVMIFVYTLLSASLSNKNKFQVAVRHSRHLLNICVSTIESTELIVSSFTIHIYDENYR